MYVFTMNYFLFAVMFLLFSGCDSIFGTRDAEDPKDDVARSLWLQPTTPEIVLVNMSNAFLERNSDNYMRCLTDPSTSGRNFLYIPDQETAISNPGSFTEWGLEEERLYINFIFSKSSLPDGALSRLVFTPFEPPSIPSDTALFDEVYDLQIEHELINVPTNMSGISSYYIRLRPMTLWFDPHPSHSSIGLSHSSYDKQARKRRGPSLPSFLSGLARPEVLPLGWCMNKLHLESVGHQDNT